MRLLNKEVEKRVTVKLDKSITTEETKGIMTYGKDNDYPQVIEKLILGSQTAKAAANILAKFIGGDGFENESIGLVEVGKDAKGKPVTLNSIRRNVAESIAKFHGAYIACSMNMEGEVGNTKVVPFKFVRLSKEDDSGYCALLGVHTNWEKDPDDIKKFKKEQITWWPHFNRNAVEANWKESESKKEKFKGQIYSLYIDDTYLYPLSPFDSVHLDMDTEYQIQLFKNREIREGFSDKIVMRRGETEDSQDEKETIEKIKSWAGPDGDKILIFTDEVDENGNIKKDGAFAIDKVPNNINDKLFDQWEKSIPNNIRKAAYGLPAVLIDYEMGTLGAASGEMISQAVNYYNAVTMPLRSALEECIKDIYSHHASSLKDNINWTIKPTKLIAEQKDDISTEKLKAQANLKGSVGGVTALIQLQMAVSEGTSSVDAAVEVVKEIYGINEETAKKMVGQPKPKNTQYGIPPNI